MGPGIQNYYVRVGNDWQVVQGDELEELLESGEVAFSDTIEVGEGLRFTFIYLQDPNNPALPPPIGNPGKGSPPSPPPRYSLSTSYYDTFSEFLDRFINADRYVNGEWVPTNNPPLNEEQVRKLIFAHMSGIPSDDAYVNEVLGGLETLVMEEIAAEFEFPSIKDRAKALKNRGRSLAANGRANLAFLREQLKGMKEGPEKEKLRDFLKEASRRLDELENALKELDGVTTQEDLQAVLSKVNDLTAGLKGHLKSANEFSLSDSYMTHLLGSLITAFDDDMQSLEGVVNQVNLYSEVESGDWSSLLGGIRDAFQESLEASYNDAFEGLLEEGLLKDLSSEDAAKLRFAHYFPDLVTDPAIKAQLAQLQAQATGSLSKLWGIPEGYIPELSEDSVNRFTAEIGKSYYDTFNTTLDEYDLSGLAQELGLSEEEVANYVKYLHFNPDATFPGNDRLKEAVANIEKITLGKVRGSYALPESFEIESGAILYNAVLNGEFMRQFDYNLSNRIPSLTSAQIAAVRIALKNPLNPNVTSETKALIQEIYSKTVKGIRSEYNLPATWAPPITLLGDIGNISDKTRRLWDSINDIEDKLNKAYSLAGDMGKGPQKTALLTILAIISRALAELKELIAFMQVEDSAIALDMTNLEKNLLDFKAQEGIEKQEEIDKKQEKMKGWKDVMKWLGPTLKIMGAVFLAAVGGPVGIAIAAVLIAEVASGKDILGKAIQAAGNAIVKAGGPAWLAVAVELVIIIALTAVGGGFVGIYVFFEKSNVMERFLTDVLKIKNEWVVMGISMGLQLAVEIAMMLVLTAVTGGAAAPLLIATIMAKVAAITIKILMKVINFLTKLLNRFGKVADKIIKALIKALNKMIENLMKSIVKLEKIAAKLKAAEKLQKASTKGGKGAEKLIKEAREELFGKLKLFDRLLKTLQITKTGLDVAAAGQQLGIELKLAEIALLQGEYDSEIARLEAMIKLLRKILDKILEGLEGSGSWMVDIGDQQKNFWGDKSAVASQIAGALGG